MLMPKRVKRRRVFRGRMKGKAQRGNFLAYGDFGIVATEPSWVTARQIEAARIALTRYTTRGGQVWIKIFPDKPVTAKPAETRMGSGKGSPEYWVAVVKPGACCSRSLACPRLMLVKRCAWPATSCPCAASSLPVKATERMVSNE